MMSSHQLITTTTNKPHISYKLQQQFPSNTTMILEGGNSVQADHTVVVVVYIQEIKPWPPSHSLRSLSSVFLQWRNTSDGSSGHTRHVVPTIGDEKIKFSESFKVSFKAPHDKYLELNLFEPNNTTLVGTVIIDLDKYGDFRKTVSVNAPLSFKRGLRITAQPVVLIKIHPLNKHTSCHSSSKYIQSKGPSSPRDSGELVNRKCLEETIITQSNLILSSSFDLPPQEGSIGNGITSSPSKPELKQASSVACEDTNEGESFSSSISSESGTSRKEYIPFSNNHQEIQISSHTTESETPTLPSSPTSMCLQAAGANIIPNNRRSSLDRADLVRQLHEKIVKGRNRYKENAQQLVEGNVDKCSNLQDDVEEEENVGRCSSVETVPTDCKDGVRRQENAQAEQSKTKVEDTICAEDIKKIDALVNSCTGGGGKNNSCDKGKLGELEYKIEKLERELREVAAAEISLYSIIPEHGSSKNKLYAPARRLSRTYFHACKHGSAVRSASAAKSAVSGLLLVIKACANDVSRLTFWLSNLVALRVIISKADENSQQHVPSTRHKEVNASQKSKDKKPSPKKNLSTPRHKRNLLSLSDDCDDWDDPNTFIKALEKIEASIFSRITESVWLQTFTPHMQPASEKSNIRPNKVSRKTQNYKRTPSLADQEQVNFSLEFWKKAIEDAHKKLCPVRSGGHDCACLPVFTKSIMEQCVNRLDVSLFNALLRDSADEIPTDLESYQVCNSKVLPVSAGISSFGTGAQLKNVITNWSSSLSDLFDISSDKSKADEAKLINDGKHQFVGSFKFPLLDELSDLMMLPKYTLLNKSFIKEVCPTFSAALIKRVLSNFVPDEFCPEKIPEAVFIALDSKDVNDNPERIQSIPCNATPIVYFPPSATSLASFLQYRNELRRNQSSVLQKSYISDDELEQVSSPLSSIIFDHISVSSARWKPKENGLGSSGSVRHQLLWEVWRDVDL